MLLIFDLDGTLLNTIGDLGRACNYALDKCGFPTHPESAYPRMVGNGINRLIFRALPADSQTEAEVQRVRAWFVAYYNQHDCELTHPYEGIVEVLTALKKAGYTLAVASNKYQTAVETIVENYFPCVFSMVVGERDGHPRKPDPEIVHTIRHFFPMETVYIGDSLVDVETAKNAGVRMIACSWGFTPRDELLARGVQVIDHPTDLLSVLHL